MLSFDGYNVTQSFTSLTHNGPANAVDNSEDTCAVTNYGKGNYWRIQFNQTLTVDSVELRLKGGEYLEYKKVRKYFKLTLDNRLVSLFYVIMHFNMIKVTTL